MLKKWLGWPGKQSKKKEVGVRCDLVAPSALLLGEAKPLPLDNILYTTEKFAALDWEQVDAWVEQTFSSDLHGQVWQQAQQGWLLHLRDCLGADYYLLEDKTNYVLSPLDQHLAEVALVFMNRAKRRVQDVLQNMACVREQSRNVLIICRDDEDYYGYVSNFYAQDDVEIARSGGMFLNHGCPHFVTMDADLSFMEIVIVHELAHNYLAHLPLPLWLNEGLAVNVERRLVNYIPQEFTPREMFEQHQAHWDVHTIQDFWSGVSFKQQETMHLSYDLAAQMVAMFAKNWEALKLFVQQVSYEDAGAEAARANLGLCLGDFVSGMLGKAQSQGWEPEKV